MGRKPTFDPNQEHWVVYREIEPFEQPVTFAVGNLAFCLECIGYIPRVDVERARKFYGYDNSNAVIYALAQEEAREYLKVATKAKSRGRVENCGNFNIDTIVCLNAAYYARYKDWYVLDLENQVEFVKEYDNLFSQEKRVTLLKKLNDSIRLLTESPEKIAYAELKRARGKALHIQNTCSLCR